MSKKNKSTHGQLPIPNLSPEVPLLSSVETGVVLPLEVFSSTPSDNTEDRPELPARWESAQILAEQRNVLPVVLRQIRPVPAIEYLNYLLGLSKDEGYVWVVYGTSGSGKSTFFHTLQHQTNNKVRTHIIDGKSPDIAEKLSDQVLFSKYLTDVIQSHKDKNGQQIPLVIILEERENEMKTEERSAIVQSLRNILRPPGPGKNVVFVLPVTNSNTGTLFLDQARETGVCIPLGHNSIYTFQGPPHTEHVDIVVNLFTALYERDISDFGLQRSQLQVHVSTNQTIGQYMRVVREELAQQNRHYTNTIRSHHYRPFTVIMCFVNPLPAYRTEPIIKGLTINAYGKVRTGELLRATQGQKAQRWQGRERILANIIETLDIRIVEIPPQIITKILYAYGWQHTIAEKANEDTRTLINDYLTTEGIDYNTPKSVRQNIQQQLGATNLFRIITGQQTQSYSTPRYLGHSTPNPREQERQSKEGAELAVTRLACELSRSNQHQLHGMVAQALGNLLDHSSHIASVSDYKGVYPEASLTVSNARDAQMKVIRSDVIVELQDKLFLLEFCWRSEDHFTYGDAASYVLRKINESYLNLPLVKALVEG